MAATMNKKLENVTAASLAVDGTGLQEAPALDFGEFFHGHTRVSGWFTDRFGNPKRHFCGDFFGEYKNDLFVLNEKLFYTDGVVETRVWNIDVTDDGVFSAESDSLIGGASGVVRNNVLSMQYAMKVQIAEGKQWALNMKDTMILQPDGSLHNITHVYKWGIRIGTVSSQYRHHDGNGLCANALTGELFSDEASSVSARLLSSV